jgi:hypothetical protein
MTIQSTQRVPRGLRIPTSPKLCWILTGLCLIGGSVGCRGGNPLFPAPGPLNKQQASAVIHDPYPDRDIAPYDAASRPPGYENPLPEPVRNRIVPDSMPWLGR